MTNVIDNLSFLAFFDPLISPDYPATNCQQSRSDRGRINWSHGRIQSRSAAASGAAPRQTIGVVSFIGYQFDLSTTIKTTGL